MIKILITGFSGFVSRHFVEYLEKQGEDVIIMGIDLVMPGFSSVKDSHIKYDFQKADLLDKAAIESIIRQFQPDFILHLASRSSVEYSWQFPVESFFHNTNIFLNLLEAVRLSNLHCRILSVGSSEEYGDVDEDSIPLREEYITNPLNPYAVASVSQEMLSQVYVSGYDLDIVMTRSFNHCGPYQKETFAISSFAKQLVELKLNLRDDHTIITGDTNIIRDVVDVRDVAAAYFSLLKNGRKGEIYNVCSGTGFTLREIIQKMASIIGLSVSLKVDPNLLRPKDNKIIIGSNEKIRRDINWVNKIPLEKSLADVLTYWQNKMESE